MASNPFDLRSMFLGDEGLIVLLVIAFRTAFMFLYALLLLRIMGKRGVARLSSWQYVIIVALGSAVGDPMIYADVPLLHGCVVITTIVFLEWGLSRLSLRHPRLERAVTGAPLTVVRDGEVFREALRAERVSDQDLREFLRMHGVPSLDRVEWAVLEDSGHLSVIVKDERRSPGDPELWSRGVKDRAGTDTVERAPRAGSHASEP